MTTRVPLNRDTLAWARTALHVSVEEAAKAANVSVEQYRDFETGAAKPTVRQAHLIAKRVDRSLAFLMAPAPTNSDVASTVDFRGRNEGELPAQLFKQMRRADVQRTAFLELTGEPVQTTRPGPIDWGNTASRAHELRSAFGLAKWFRPADRKPGAAFNFWRSTLEAHGYLVFQTTGIDHAVFRALSIHHERLPIILLNGSDAANGKVFSLFHEVAHLANRTSGVCLFSDDVESEVLSNRFAADFLMPADEVQRVVRTGLPQATVDQVAQEFGVSRYAAAIRLRTLNYIDEGDLDDFKRQSEAEWHAARAKMRESKGGPGLAKTRTRDLGPMYLSAVFGALESERLNFLDATYLLGARVPTIERMIADYRGGGRK